MTETPTPSQPQTFETIEPPEPAFGWTPYAEQVNGRFAMIGFVLLLLQEVLTCQDIFTWMGLR